MFTIKISDLSPAGSELFSDSESYMTELTDDDLMIVNGGGTPIVSITITARLSAKSSQRCLDISIKQTGKVPTQLTPTPPAVSQFLKDLSNPFNSF